MKRNWLYVIVIIAVTLSVWGGMPAQKARAADAVGDYRSVSSGNWNSTATWERYDGTNWVAAIGTPTNADGVITIQSGTIVTITAAVTADQVDVSAGGQVSINSGIAWSIADGTGIDLTVNGTVTNNGTLTRLTTATFTINAGGKYIHNTGTTVNGSAWTNLNSNSDFEYRQIGAFSTAPTYGNLIINTGGNATLGSGTLSIVGNLVIQSGVNYRILNTGSSSATINLTGDLVINGTGVFTGNVGSAALATLNIGGSINSGSFSSGAGTGGFVINFIGGATSVSFSPTGGYSSNGNIIVTNTPAGKTVTLGGDLSLPSGRALTVNGTLNTSTNAVTGAGAFTLNAGATLGLGSPDGLDAGTSLGNIRVSGARTFDAGANFVFNGTGEQVAGDGFPSTVNVLTIASGAQVILPIGIAATTLTNNGTITQTQTVPTSGAISFVGIGGYGGVTIDANGIALGSTEVAIKQAPGTSCVTGGQNTVGRCFIITPGNGSSGYDAIVTFYFDSADLNGETCSSLLAYHYDGGSIWTPLTEGASHSYTRQCTTDPYSIQVTGVTDFSPFVLADGVDVPTAVTLTDLTASNPASPAPIAFGVLGLVAAGLLLRRRIVRSTSN